MLKKKKKPKRNKFQALTVFDSGCRVAIEGSANSVSALRDFTCYSERY